MNVYPFSRSSQPFYVLQESGQICGSSGMFSDTSINMFTTFSYAVVIDHTGDLVASDVDMAGDYATSYSSALDNDGS